MMLSRSSACSIVLRESTAKNELVAPVTFSHVAAPTIPAVTLRFCDAWAFAYGFARCLRRLVRKQVGPDVSFKDSRKCVPTAYP